MGELYFSVNKDNGRILCLSPLTDRLLSLADEKILDHSGYFLYEKERDGDSTFVRIIAQVFSEDAVFMLCNTFKMS